MTAFEFSILFIYFLTSEARMLPLEGGREANLTYGMTAEGFIS